MRLIRQSHGRWRWGLEVCGADPLVRAGPPGPAVRPGKSVSCPRGRRGRRPRTRGSALLRSFMAIFSQLHHPDFSLWQSAVEQTVANIKGSVDELRGDCVHAMIEATNAVASNLKIGVSPAHEAQAGGANDSGGWAKYCSSIWWEIAKAQVEGNLLAEQNWRNQLGQFTTCDVQYAQAAEQYVAFQLKKERIPYRVW